VDVLGIEIRKSLKNNLMELEKIDVAFLVAESCTFSYESYVMRFLSSLKR
jgi:hypothetical protein